MKQILLVIFFCSLINYQVEKPFFDFDEAYYYQITKAESDKYSHSDSLTPKMEKVEFYRISRDNYPKSLDDKWFFEKIQKYYPTKKKIEKDKLHQLSKIFSEKKKKKTVFGACDPIYRNIFIFKKNGKVVGISKICFGCLEEYTIGTERSTKNFGSHKEYEELKKLVKWSDSR